MSKIKTYAGIGSRTIPKDVAELFFKIGGFLAKKGYTLRSGGATGSDKMFEDGCDSEKGAKEIYVPWRGFNDIYYGTEWTQAGWDMAKEFHPNWDNLKLGAKQLMARNSHQCLGLQLDDPVDFVCCYTEDGKLVGGTAQALRIALHHKIKIFNFGDPKTLVKFRKFCKTL